MKNIGTSDLAIIALMAALLCILAPISVPLGFTPIPVTLGLFMVVVIGIILGRNKGFICILIYLLLGAVGLPVFSGYMGGIQTLFGPTGGYIWGYLLLIWMTGSFVEKFEGKRGWTLLGILGGIILCYLSGVTWMAMQLHMEIKEAVLVGVIPFFPFDILKAGGAAIIFYPLRKRLLQQNLLRL